MSNIQRSERYPELEDSAENVRDFYEQYPYPRPIESLDKYKELWNDENRRRAEHHLFFPTTPCHDNYRILIAGCGTSQAAKHAMRRPNAQVTGIDFSETSLRCTNELKKKYNLINLHVHQLAVEKVKDLGISFDQIVCTGVLHHLPDPDAGLKALREVLKPDGAMHLMVYAPYGRRGIYMLQKFCRLLGIQATEEGIHDLIGVLKVLPPGHPLENLLKQAPDFRQEAALADALLNPQDRAFSVSELFDFINKGSMKFGRWVKQAQYSPRCGLMAKIPLVSQMQRLSPEEQYAAAELFRGTMLRHSLIAYRNDNPHRNNNINFDNDAWLSYVPIRLPDTVCIEERLPKGAAAVLINQTHTYTDLFLPIDTKEKLLYNGIDGICNINDIAEKELPSSEKNSRIDIARTFFEKLWWYDQVVFDAAL